MDGKNNIRDAFTIISVIISLHIPSLFTCQESLAPFCESIHLDAFASAPPVRPDPSDSAQGPEPVHQATLRLRQQRHGREGQFTC